MAPGSDVARPEQALLRRLRLLSEMPTRAAEEPMKGELEAMIPHPSRNLRPEKAHQNTQHLGEVKAAAGWWQRRRIDLAPRAAAGFHSRLQWGVAASAGESRVNGMHPAHQIQMLSAA